MVHGSSVAPIIRSVIGKTMISAVFFVYQYRIGTKMKKAADTDICSCIPNDIYKHIELPFPTLQLLYTASVYCHVLL